MTAQSTIWINGTICDAETARIDPRDRGFTLGDGVFETIRVKNGHLLRLARHFERLAAGLRLLEIDMPFHDTALADAMTQIADASGLQSALLRLTVTRGPGPRGIVPTQGAAPTVTITAGAHVNPTPVKAMIATVTRRNELSPLSHIKSTNYLDSILARMEAARAQADDAILVNTAGRIAESTVANLFAVIADDLVTPPLADGALPGIVRAEILALFGAVERPLLPQDLARASEVFLTSSAGVRPIVALDGRTVAMGPVTARLAATYSD